MCRLEVISYYCSSPYCSEPEFSYKQRTTYFLCASSYLGGEEYHVNTHLSDPSTDARAEKQNLKSGTCRTCQASMRAPATDVVPTIGFEGDRAAPNEQEKVTAIFTPREEESCAWLCPQLGLDIRAQNLCTDILKAVYNRDLDGNHQDAAVLGAVVFFSTFCLLEKGLKVRTIKQTIGAVKKSQIEAAYTMLWKQSKQRLRQDMLMAALRYEFDPAKLSKLPKPVRNDVPVRDHWMM